MKRMVSMFALVTMVSAVGLLSSGCTTLDGDKKCGHGDKACGAKMEKACCGTCKGKKAECKAGEKKAECKAKKACCGTCKAEKPAGEAKAACPADCTKPCCAEKK